MELDHGSAHERVRRERVGAIAPAIDDEHAMTGTREQERRRRAGAPRADNHDVILRCGGLHHRFAGLACFARSRQAVRIHPSQPALTDIDTDTPFVSTSNTAERARDCSTISCSFSGGASPLIEKVMRMP